MEKTKKTIRNNVGLQTLFCVVATAIIFLAYAFIGNRFEMMNWEKDVSSRIIENDYNALAVMEKVEKKDDVITFYGWAFYVNSEQKGVNIGLREVGGEDVVVFSTKIVERKDVAELFSDVNCLTNIGFEGEINESKLKKETCYEILLEITYEKNMEKSTNISLGQYVYDGTLYRYNPQVFSEPQISNTLIQDVINYGDIYFYDGELGVWIYEYKGNMYWITDSNFEFDASQQTYVPCHAYTTQLDLLPERMREIGRFGYDYIFEEREMQLGIEDANYRVAYRELQDNCIVTWMRTGRYNYEINDWVWQAFIPVMKKIERS